MGAKLFAPSPAFERSPQFVEVVVARYAEDCSWLLKSPYLDLLPYTTIYNKGPDNIHPTIKSRTREILTLPNVGKCDHTFMQHIVRRLSDGVGLFHLTVFVAASAIKFRDKADSLQRIVKAFPDVPNMGNNVDIYETHKGFSLTEWRTSDAQNRMYNNESRLLPASPRPFGPWFKTVFGPRARMVGPCVLGGVCVGLRSKLMAVPRHVYVTLLQHVATHSNPEAGHYIERVLGALCLGTVSNVS